MGAGNSSSISSKEDIDRVEMISKELEASPSCKGTAAGALGGDYHANSIASLIQERKKLLEEKKIIHKSEWKASSEKEVEERAAFESEMVYLPDLAWRKVFEYVKDSEEKKMLLNMTKLWRNLMLNERSQFLFPFVLPLLVKTELINLEDAFHCRLVCKKWKESFDACLQQPCNRNNSWDRPTKLSARFPASIEQQVVFLETFPAPDQNPFLVSRSLKLDTTPNTDSDAFKPIWQMAIEVESLFLDFWGLYDFDFPLAADAGWPNLKHLAIDDFKRNQDNVLVFTGGIPADLQTLALYSNGGNPRVTEDILPRVGTSLKMLVVKGHGCRSGYNLQSSKSNGDYLENPVEIIQHFGPFPELKTFRLQSRTGCPAELPAECKEYVPSLEEIDWKYTDPHYRDVPASCGCVNIIGNSLRRLSLSFTGEFSAKYFNYHEFAEENLRLILSHLEILELTLERFGVKNIDFILPCESLKEFNLTFCRHFHSEENAGGRSSFQGKPSEEIIDFNSFEERMYESNIWEIFPDLRKLRISIIPATTAYRNIDGFCVANYDKKESKVYTRSGLKKYRGVNNYL